MTFAACCRPVPGDQIMGYLSAGKGVVVHRVNCRNVREFRKHPDHCIDVNWAPIRRGMFEVALHILAKNVPGVWPISRPALAKPEAILKRSSNPNPTVK